MKSVLGNQNGGEWWRLLCVHQSPFPLSPGGRPDHVPQSPLKLDGVMQLSFGHGMWEKVMHVAFRFGTWQKFHEILHTLFLLPTFCWMFIPKATLFALIQEKVTSVCLGSWARAHQRPFYHYLHWTVMWMRKKNVLSYAIEILNSLFQQLPYPY